ncbi:sensor histidine kinase [Bosea sp. (in: a-proteobacteria)]|uniref:sensor histidine kinase n=1 Tax=Bosea sp. (in: a-proteobacteria) TaxID=1871050 RepID=UPI00260AB4EB|nr:sensor histidine kinase [Bosea sp. (in: a-proteobacteria)]MCO5090984.1 sensor histidine kinase [Bosea sp. (in: a-proteobacteria)]
MMHLPIQNELDIEVYQEPSLIVSGDGNVRAFNRAARLALPRAARDSSLFDLCVSPAGTLRNYLTRCSSLRPPAMMKLSFDGHGDVSEFQCRASVLTSRPGVVAILLRLFSMRDAAIATVHDGMMETEGRLALRQIEELRRDRQRLGEQLALLAEALRVAEEQKRELHAEMQLVRADERERIACDIHDQVGHEMAVVLAEVRKLRDDALGFERERLCAIEEHVFDVGRRIHRAVIGGRPRIVEELGLVRALEATVVSFAADGGLAPSFVSRGAVPEALPVPIESALYRVAQEAMTNVVRHAPEAQTLALTLEFSIESVSLAIADDGPGFLMEPLWHAGGEHGIGLRGMQQRVRDIGGSLRIDAHPGKGTTITASVPLGHLLHKRATVP